MITEFRHRGWAAAISSGRLHEQSAILVVAKRGAVGLVLALTGAPRDDEPLTLRHDDGGLIW